mmetsp:Transcript_34033/g.96406  ORF Transcript_34033/g.96406 Transcript_34033/m.96406 type:complete len:193 (-) Transcript_34033:2071-2649(-)
MLRLPYIRDTSQGISLSQHFVYVVESRFMTMAGQHLVDVVPPGALDSGGMQVDFAVRRYTVKTRSGERKEILSDVYGSANKGELMGIMGPSGAGKSTLLDTVAGVRPQPNAQHDSVVLLNGLSADTIARQRTCYVMQSDILVSSATVREALTTSAFLRLPLTLTREEKHARVDALIDELVSSRPPHKGLFFA